MTSRALCSCRLGEVPHLVTPVCPSLTPNAPSGQGAKATGRTLNHANRRKRAQSYPEKRRPKSPRNLLPAPSGGDEGVGDAGSGLLGVDGLRQDQRTREMRKPSHSGFGVYLPCVRRLLPGNAGLSVTHHSAVDSKHRYIRPWETDYGMLATWTENNTTRLPWLQCLRCCGVWSCFPPGRAEPRSQQTRGLG